MIAFASPSLFLPFCFRLCDCLCLFLGGNRKNCPCMGDACSYVWHSPPCPMPSLNNPVAGCQSKQPSASGNLHSLCAPQTWSQMHLLGVAHGMNTSVNHPFLCRSVSCRAYSTTSPRNMAEQQPAKRIRQPAKPVSIPDMATSDQRVPETRPSLAQCPGGWTHTGPLFCSSRGSPVGQPAPALSPRMGRHGACGAWGTMMDNMAACGHGGEGRIHCGKVWAHSVPRHHSRHPGWRPYPGTAGQPRGP